jgi:S-methylmethionine-dependent homocysteine/selenocysteine methylase
MNATAYRSELPHLSDNLFITDGGLETTLVFHEGFDLPEFAAFDVFRKADGYRVLHDYFLPYIRVAQEYETGFILESPTWRASRDWGRKLGYSPKDLRAVNLKSIAMLQDIRSSSGNGRSPLVISGCIGPRGDGYRADARMTAAEAKQYHQEQIDALRDAGADLVSAFTINYVEEAVGITRAAQSAEIPVVISFTVETDGRLPSRQRIGAAVEAVDAATGGGPAYYMINCAHPAHFSDSLPADAPWVHRIRAVRANASTKSHAELDASEELDAGDPADLGTRFAALKAKLPQLNVFGGCCGTDVRHIQKIAEAVTVH